MAKKTKLSKTHILMLGVVVVALSYLFYTTYFKAYGDTIYITNQGTATITCYGTWTDGVSFTISPGNTYTFLVDNIGGRYTGRCYCPETYQTNYVEIDTYEHWYYYINLPCEGTPTTTLPPTTCEDLGYYTSPVVGLSCEEKFIGGLYDYCWSCKQISTTTTTTHTITTTTTHQTTTTTTQGGGGVVVSDAIIGLILGLVLLGGGYLVYTSK